MQKARIDMKIIEAMKQIKDLQRKCDDIKAKVSQYSASLDCETLTYPDQKGQVNKWLQSHSDIVKEIAHLRVRIQKTNVLTNVTIQIGDMATTKSIAEWIHRRRDLAKMEETVWRSLNDKGLRETQTYQLTPGSPTTIVKRLLHYDPVLRDEKVELYRSEPFKIDSTLEITNAVTDLLEL